MKQITYLVTSALLLHDICTAVYTEDDPQIPNRLVGPNTVRNLRGAPTPVHSVLHIYISSEGL